MNMKLALVSGMMISALAAPANAATEIDLLEARVNGKKLDLDGAYCNDDGERNIGTFRAFRASLNDESLFVLLGEVREIKKIEPNASDVKDIEKELREARADEAKKVASRAIMKEKCHAVHYWVKVKDLNGDRVEFNVLAETKEGKLIRSPYSGTAKIKQMVRPQPRPTKPADAADRKKIDALDDADLAKEEETNERRLQSAALLQR